MKNEMRQSGVSCNPIRALFLKMSMMPPALLLLIILGLAVIVTMMVTGKISEEEARYLATHPTEDITASGADPSAQPWQSEQPARLRSAVFSRKPIPAATEIDSTYLRIQKVAEPRLWSDSFPSTDKVLGRTARSAIPEGNQIRAIDLQ